MITIFNRWLPGGLKRQIFLGFAAIGLFFAISAAFNIYVISGSKSTLQELFESKEPAVEALTQFRTLVIRSRMLATNWVYLRKDVAAKGELKQLISIEAPIITKELITNYQKWDNPLQIKLINEVLKDYNTLELNEKEITHLLTTFESYDDPLLKFQAEDIIENQVLPITNGMLHKLDIVISQKNNEKNIAKESMSISYDALTTSMIFIPVILIIIGFVASSIITSNITRPITKFKETISALSRGEQPENITYALKDEIGDMSRSVNILLNNIRSTKTFAEEIGNGNFNAYYNPLSKNDLLGQSLLEMRDQLKKNNAEETKRNWVKDGQVKINEVLINRHDNERVWHNDIISFIVDYLGAVQGGIYLLSDQEEGNRYLELVASYAYDSTKLRNNKILPGEGLIGQSFYNKQMVILKDIPEHTVEIYSLGIVKPQNLILVPLKVHNTCYGVLELASLNDLEKYQIDFIEKIAESVTSTISFIKINNRTKRLLDVSIEQRQLLQEQDEELRNKMEELNNTQQQTIKAKEKAEAAVIAKSQFLSVMSHEIRTPMNAVIGMTNLLLESDPKHDQVDTLNILKFSAQNLLALINDILDFNKIDSGKINLENIDFSLHELANNVRNSMLYRAVEKHIKLNINIDPALPLAFLGDPIRIAQVLNNLVSNAVKFTDHGEVNLNIKLVKKEKSFSTVHFTISDTGIGIPEDKIDIIFENFTQASSDTTRKYGGTGLGLAITKKLLDLMESEIEVESILGEGSKFGFHLKLGNSNKQLKSATNRPLSEVAVKKSLKGIKVLLVEDNDTNVIVASRFLEKWDCQYVVVDNGQSAVEKAENEYFDLILMDLQMPIMDGYEATRKIRQFNIRIPVIALTAEAMLDVKDYALESGMNDFITKPFNIDELYDKIKKYTVKGLTSQPVTNLTDDPQTDTTMVNFQKYLELADNDFTFLVQLLKQTAIDFNDAKNRYKIAAEEHNEEQLGKIAHKIAATMKLFGLAEMEGLIASQRSQLKNETVTEPEYTELTQNILRIFTKVIAEVNEKVTEVKSAHNIS